MKGLKLTITGPLSPSKVCVGPSPKVSPFLRILGPSKTASCPVCIANAAQSSTRPWLPSQSHRTNQGKMTLSGGAQQGTARDGCTLFGFMVNLLEARANKVNPRAKTLRAIKSGRESLIHRVECTQSMLDKYLQKTCLVGLRRSFSEDTIATSELCTAYIGCVQ